jgi:hypothetical protein
VTIKLSNVPERLELQIKHASDYGPVTHILTNPDDTPADLTGCVPHGQIRKNATDALPLGSFDCALGAGPAPDRYTFSVSAATSAALTPGATTADKAGQHHLDIWLVDALGRVVPTFHGPLWVIA